MKRLRLLLIFLWFFSANAVFAATPYQAALVPNDKFLSQQYHLNQIKAYDGWEIASASPQIVVAVIDSGVDISHPDLADNIWRNPDEVAGDKIDNDHNGFIDDVNGWDFIVNSPDPRPKFGGNFSVLGINHGTLVAGVIGAVGNNNLGLTGVSWKVKIMPLRVMDGEGGGQSTAVYAAIKYALAEKADIINLSMVGTVFDPALDAIIAEAYRAGVIIVAASGNEHAGAEDEDFSLNLALHPQYPICHDGGEGYNFVLGVGAVDDLDVKSVFSNYGSKCLDLTAPGEGFFSTLFFAPVMPEFTKYYGGWWSGTSLAAPQVSAAAALLKGFNPKFTNTDIYRLLMETTDNIDLKNQSFKGLLGGGRLNLAKALAAAKTAKLGAADSNQSASITIVAAGAGSQPEVKIFNDLGELQSSFLAYHNNFKGGVSLASADVNGDGVKEIITGAGAGGGPHIRIFNLKGEVVSQFFAYPINFSGGVNLAAADLDSNGQAEIITAPLGGMQSLIKIFDASGKVKKEFLAFEKSFNGGVNLALTDINGDGQPEIIAAQRSGGNRLRIFNAAGQLQKEFTAFESGQQGIAVASANLFGDVRQEIMVAQNQGLTIRIFSSSGDLLQLIKLTDKINGQGSLAVFNQNIVVGYLAGQEIKLGYYNFAGKLLQTRSMLGNYTAGFNLHFYQ